MLRAVDPVLARILWAALLGLAVGTVLGILVAAMGKRRRPALDGLRATYLESFRYALSGDPDGAIEQLTLVDPDAPGGVETWFAMGSLLRRKGDHAGAIRLHEELIANQRLHPSVRQAAAYELALDFRRAGMRGRAVQALERVLEAEPTHREALRELREICEEEGAWARAVEAQLRIDALGGGGGSILSHLHAAHARSLLAAGDAAGAAAAIGRALAADPEGADALCAQAEILAARGDSAGAAEALGAALDRCPDLASLDSVPLDAVPDPIGFLRERLARHPDDPWLRLALARQLRGRDGTEEAIAILRSLVADVPQLVEPRQELVEILLAERGAASESIRRELGNLVGGLGGHTRLYGCTRCQVELAGFSFRCPRCFGWDTVARIHAPQAADREIGTDRAAGS